MRKSILSLAIASVMALSLAGCGGSGSSAATTTAASADTAAADTQAGETSAADDAEAAQKAGGTGGVSSSNPNAGLGMYPGTSAKGEISVEVTTISVMNPILMTYNNEFSVSRHVWDCLVKLDENNNIIPAAAESWESSEDGLKWTFKIREGQKWVDSTGAVIGDVTANDFVFAWSELLNPNNAAEYYQFATVFKNAQKYYDYASGVSSEEVTLDEVGFHATDDYTLEIELENYLPYLLQYLKFEVMSPIYEPFYTEVGADNYGISPENLAYNGPFYMTEWVTENRIVVEKNKEWYNADQVSLDKINFLKFTDTNTKYNAFLGGELDMMDVTGEQRAAFEAEGFKVSSYVGGYSYWAWVNCTGTSDLSNANLRRAFSAALNRRQLIDTVFKNDNEVPQAMTLGISGVNTDTFADAVVADNGSPLYPDGDDPETAKEYLALALEELGYNDASELKISLMTSEGTQNELLSQVIQEQIRQNLGVEIDIEILTITEWRVRRNAHEFDFCVGGWGPDYNDPLTDLELMYSTNGNNHSGYNNPEYDALIDATKTETDLTEREKLFIQCEYIVQDELPVIPLYWRHEDYVASEKMSGGYLRLPFQAYNLIYTTLDE